MVRGKKKESLTSEDRLQAALVPESEQPYKVPGNWCWVRLGELSTSQYGYTAKAIKNDAYPKMLRITDIQEYGVNWSDVPNCEITQDNLEKYRLSDGDIVIARTGATTGKSFLLIEPCNSVFASYLIRVRVNKGSVPRYVFNFFQTDNYWKQISELSSGIAQPGVNAAKLQSLCFPLAPFPEQLRIVDRIESLFAKLDEAKQKAQNVLDSFETRKAAILHKAFTGELTAQWRKEHGVGMESWENKELCQLAKEIKAGGDKPDDFTEEADETHNIPVVANGVVDEGIVGYTATARFSGETVTVAGRGTIGFSVYRTYAFFPIVRLIVIQPKDFVKAAYIKYAFDAFPESGTGSSIPQLTVPMVKEKVIPLPKLDEQTEIVRILDDLLAKEQQAKEAVEGVLEQIDLIKKAILARAFRGELGTNDPSEESAVELVKEIL